MSDVVIRELFTETLHGDYEGDDAWDAVRKLRQLGTREVFDIASRWCASDNPLERARGLDVLAQLGKTAEHPTNRFPDECYAVAVTAIMHEAHERPLNSAITALGHLGNPAGVPLVAQFLSHNSPQVRFSVAFALGCFPNDPLSVKTLLKLTEDSDKDVRDWATFGLGVLGDKDSSEIRDALIKRLSDSDAEVIEEALVGLAKRRDMRILPMLLDRLHERKATPRVIEAVSMLLGLPEGEAEWSEQDYEKALKAQFQ